MNYQEIVNAQQSAFSNYENLPFGKLYRKQIDNKFRLVIDLKPGLSDNIVFCESLKKDQSWTASHAFRQQVQFSLNEDSAGIYGMELDLSSYQTLAQLLANEPATIAQKGFIENVVNSLFEAASKLHDDGIYHLCFAPQNILIRKGDDTPMLLCHGSFYTGVNDVENLYGTMADFIAPEVMNREKVDERSDIYSLGKLIAFLYDQSSMPLELKQVVKKATAESPDERYRSIDDMKSHLAAKRSMRKSVIALGIALFISLLGIWLYLDLVPQTEYIEFVEPAPKESSEDPLNNPYDPEMELLMGDSVRLSEQDALYMQKAEEIYRRRFEDMADKALSKVYDNKNMGSGEKSFMAASQAALGELMKQKDEMVEEMGIDEDRAGAIAQEIIERITSEKTEGQTQYGYQK